MMKTLEFEKGFNVNLKTLWAYHESPVAFARMVPNWEEVKVVEMRREVPGKIHLQVKLGPFYRPWIGSYKRIQAEKEFNDTLIKGPFRHWDHRHLFSEKGEQSVLRDVINYEVPFGKFGEIIAGKFVEKKLQRQFRWRHARLERDLEIHARCGRKLKVILTGASGFVGTETYQLLLSGGHEVLRLVRAKGQEGLWWSPATGEVEDSGRLENADAWIHLSGDNISEGRWSETKKKKIYDSRIQTTRAVVKIIEKLNHKPKALVSASAIGFYGSCGEFDESAPQGTDFLAKVCADWEAEAKKVSPEVRLVQPRIGVVNGVRGGVIAKLLLLFSFGCGGPIGLGKRQMSWVDVEDLSRMLYEACFNEKFKGVFNAVSPEGVTNEKWTKVFAKRLKKPAFFFVPPKLLEFLLGEMARATILSDAKINPQRLKAWGFQYQFESIEKSFQNQLEG